MQQKENQITIQYRIKESELEQETARLYEKALDHMAELVNTTLDYDTTALSYQTLDNINLYKAKLSECLSLFQNVENIVVQYLDFRANDNTEIGNPTTTETNTAKPNKHIEQPQIIDDFKSPYEQQRKLAQKLQEQNALSTERSK